MGHDRLTSLINAEGLLADVRGDEDGLVVVPSYRVTAEEFLTVLHSNGFGPRTLGEGFGSVVDDDGVQCLVKDVLLFALPKSRGVSVAKLARLCGVIVAKVVAPQVELPSKLPD